MMDGDLAVFLEVCAKAPKKPTGKRPRVLDIDNVAKGVLDSLQGIIYENDSAIRALSIKYGEPVPGGALNIKVVSA